MKKIRSKIKGDIKAMGKKGSFAQNFALVFSGSAANVVLQIVLTPIITRIYSEEHYGVFAIFNALVMNCSLFGHLFFSSAFVLPRKEIEFHALLRITVITTTVLSGAIFISSILFPSQVLSLFNIEAVGDWIYLLGPAVFITALITIIDNWTVRLKAFKPKVVIGVSSNLVQRGSVILAGTFVGPAGKFLILGDIIAKLMRIVLSLWLAVKDKRKLLLTKVDPREIKAAFHKYKQYPMYIFPANFITRFSGDLPVFLLAVPFGIDKVGAYAFCLGMLDIPMRLIGNSITPVFLQKTAEISSENLKELQEISKKLMKRLLLVAVAPFAVINVFGDWIFEFFFGVDWLLSGTILLVLGHYYYFYLISNPFTVFFRIMRRERSALYAKIAFFILRLGAIIFGLHLGDFMITMILLGGVSVVFYLGQMVYVLSLIKLNGFKPMLASIALYGTAIGLMWLLKLAIQTWIIS